MRRDFRFLKTLGMFGVLLALGTGCDTSLPVPPPDLRAKTTQAVQPRFDAKGARFETRKAQNLYEVKVWMSDPAGSPERMKAICWFDERKQLVLVRYQD